MLLFHFLFFSDWWSLKIENENNNSKTLTEEAVYIRLESLEFSLYPGWLELPLTGTNFHGLKPVKCHGRLGRVVRVAKL